MKSYKVALKLVRSFSLGFSIYSPTLNGLYIEFYFGCFIVAVWSRGKRLFGAENYWK